MHKGCPLLEIAYTSLFSFTRPTKKNYFINEIKKNKKIKRTTCLPNKFRLTQINPSGLSLKPCSSSVACCMKASFIFINMNQLTCTSANSTSFEINDHIILQRNEVCIKHLSRHNVVVRYLSLNL